MKTHHQKHLSKNSDNEQRDVVEAVIAENRARHTTETVSILGYRFEIHPGVFSPLATSCSGVIGLAAAAQPLWQGRSVIEFGCGSGIFACLFALAGARRVHALDSNPAALNNTRRNAEHHNLTDIIIVQEADTVGAGLGDESIDIVYCDPPFSRYRPPTDALEQAFLDPGLHMARSALAAISGAETCANATLLLCLSSRTDLDERTELFAGFPLTARPLIVIDDGQASFTLWQIRRNPQ